MRITRRISRMSAGALVALSLVAVGATLSIAAPNPSGTGQPTQSCGSPTAFVMPPGFSTGGFTGATLVYAGAPNAASTNHTNSTKPVAQYDVACFQRTQAQLSVGRQVIGTGATSAAILPTFGANGAGLMIAIPFGRQR